MNAKETFLTNEKELVRRWTEVAHEAWFEKVMVYCRGELLSMRPSHDMLIGAELALHTLQNLCDGDSESFTVIDAHVGLNHNLTHTRVDDKSESTVDSTKED